MSASCPPTKNSLKFSPSSNIAGSAIGDHIEYLPPISFGNSIMFSLKPNFWALSGWEVMAIKWFSNLHLISSHALDKAILCRVSSVLNDLEETIKKVSSWFNGLTVSLNSTVSGPVKKICLKFLSFSLVSVSINNLGPSKEPPIPIVTMFLIPFLIKSCLSLIHLSIFKQQDSINSAKAKLFEGEAYISL